MTAPTRARRGGRPTRGRYTPPPTRWADTYPTLDPDTAPDVDWVRVQRALNGNRAEAALMNPDEFAEAVWSAILRRGLTPSATADLLHCNMRAVRTVIHPPVVAA